MQPKAQAVGKERKEGRAPKGRKNSSKFANRCSPKLRSSMRTLQLWPLRGRAAFRGRV